MCLNSNERQKFHNSSAVSITNSMEYNVVMVDLNFLRIRSFLYLDPHHTLQPPGINQPSLYTRHVSFHSNPYKFILGRCFFLTYGFFLALKLADVRGKNKTKNVPHWARESALTFTSEPWGKHTHTHATRNSKDNLNQRNVLLMM